MGQPNEFRTSALHGRHDTNSTVQFLARGHCGLGLEQVNGPQF